jgi:hypothetical protein
MSLLTKPDIGIGIDVIGEMAAITNGSYGYESQRSLESARSWEVARKNICL